MKYLVTARVKPGKANKLLSAIKDNTLGQGSVAFGEYTRNMQQARLLDDGSICWIENCFCGDPLAEEKAYWQEYFQIERISAVQKPHRCKDSNGEVHHACMSCDCAEELQQKLSQQGKAFLAELQLNQTK